MKLTKNQLRRLVKEEVQAILSEDDVSDEMDARRLFPDAPWPGKSTGPEISAEANWDKGILLTQKGSEIYLDEPEEELQRFLSVHGVTIVYDRRFPEYKIPSGDWLETTLANRSGDLWNE